MNPKPGTHESQIVRCETLNKAWLKFALLRLGCLMLPLFEDKAKLSCPCVVLDSCSIHGVV